MTESGDSETVLTRLKQCCYPIHNITMVIVGGWYLDSDGDVHIDADCPVEGCKLVYGFPHGTDDGFWDCRLEEKDLYLLQGLPTEESD